MSGNASSLLIAPLEALTDSSLTDPERRVLLALFSFRNKLANTVWPSAEEIAIRANISDKTWVSKLTKGLSEKGWLTKKKKGFTGGNIYLLTLPERFSKLDAEPNLDESSNMDSDTTSNLGSQSKSKLDPEPKCNEQQIEQQKEQQINTKKNSKTELDYSVWHEQPSEQVFKDWLVMRKRKKADVSQTVINNFGKEFIKAANSGYSIDYCLSECVTRAWTGFKFEWIQNTGGNHAANQQRGSTGTGASKPCAADSARAQARQLFESLDGQVGGAGIYQIR
jgi:DNA-binding MarR family transcriptional regulator